MQRPQILLVDDEPFVLEALARQLRRDYDVTAVGAGAAALEKLAAGPGFAVVLSDLRMPGMDGVELLRNAATVAPDTVRLLLTGNADVSAAADAVNEGRIFRFLMKPCPPERLRQALAAAVEQHRLITAERVLLEQTLQGSVRALVDTLGLANPVAFGRATRAKHLATQLAERLQVPNRWRVEIAVMLSQVAVVSLPPVTAEKLCYGIELDPEEQEMVARLPATTEQLLEHIPRLDEVREIIAKQHLRFEDPAAPARLQGQAIPLGARILKVVFDYDALEAQGVEAGDALQVMRTRLGDYDPDVLEALRGVHGLPAPEFVVREMPLRDVQTGMRFVDDIRLRNGMLLIPKGFEVNAAVLERIRNVAPQVLQGMVKMLVRPGAPAASSDAA